MNTKFFSTPFINGNNRKKEGKTASSALSIQLNRLQEEGVYPSI